MSGLINSLSFRKKDYKKNKNIAFLLVTIILMASIPVTLIFAYIFEDKNNNLENTETNIDVDLNTSSIVYLTNNSPLMAFTSKYDSSFPNGPNYAINKRCFDTKPPISFPFYDYNTLFDKMSWVGDDELSSWTLKFDLGAPRSVDKINIQFGDIYTSYGYAYGLKKYKYDVYVENANYPSVVWQKIGTYYSDSYNYDNQRWVSDTYNIKYSDINITDSRGCVYDFKKDWFVVANGYGHNALIFDGNGNYIHNITCDIPFYNWTYKAINDVAIIPKIKSHSFPYPTLFDGGYYISTEDGEIWVSEYGDYNLDIFDRVTVSGDDFNAIVGIATSFNPSYTNYNNDPFNLYVLESGKIYHYLIDYSNKWSIRKSQPDHTLSISYNGKRIEAVDDNVYVLGQDRNIYVYKSDLSSLIKIIYHGSGADDFYNPKDITRWGYGNIAVLDYDDRFININLEDGVIGTYHLSNLTDNGYSMCGFSSGSGFDHLFRIFVTPTYVHKQATFYKGNNKIQYNPKYFDWDRIQLPYPISKISGYKIVIYDLTFEQTPFSEEFIPKTSDDRFGWNKPCVVETTYNWYHNKDTEKTELCILKPQYNDNYISYGINGTFDIYAGVSYLKSSDLYEGLYGNTLEINEIKYKLDNESWISLTPNKITEIIYTPTQSFGRDTISFMINFPIGYIYSFKTIYMGLIQDGDIWDVYLDGNKVKEIDENLIGSGSNIMSLYISKGYHELKFIIRNDNEGYPKTLPYMRIYYDIYKATGININEGWHNITIFVKDTYNSTDTETIPFYVTTYPYINIISPEDNIGINSNITLSLDVSDNNLNTLVWFLNDNLMDKVNITTNSTFYHYEYNISLDQLIENEWNQIEVKVNDSFGHTSFGYRTFFVDFKPPIITFPNMKNNTYIPKNNTYYINVTDETLKIAYYIVNNKNVKFDLNNGLNILTIKPYEFDNGINNLTVYAEDIVGNTNTAYLNLSKDDASPVIKIIYPNDKESFWNDSSPDPIPLYANAIDFFINLSSPEILNISKTKFDDYIRLHYNSYTYIIQEFVPKVPTLTSINMYMRGYGRIKLSLYSDKYMNSDPISVGYIDINDEFNFKWYKIDMSDCRLSENIKYYLKIETLTPFNDIYIGISKNDDYKEGSTIISNIRRNEIDINFKTYYKPILDLNRTVYMWYDINGENIMMPKITTYINETNLRNNYTFLNGYNTITVYASDEFGNIANVSVTLININVGIKTDIDIEITNPTDMKWIYDNFTIEWSSNIPDYINRSVKETYTYDIKLINIYTNQTYIIANGINNINKFIINTSLYEDGFYYLVINATDGDTFDIEQTPLLRILNEEPILNITYPKPSSYHNSDFSVILNIITPNIETIFYSIDNGINIGMYDEPYSFDFYKGYTFVIHLNISDLEDGVHKIKIIVKDTENRDSVDSLIFYIDTQIYIDIKDMDVLASKTTIYIIYDYPYDLVYAEFILVNSTNTLIYKILTDDDINGTYIIKDGLPKGSYKLTMVVYDYANNTAIDIVTFYVKQSVWADIVENIVSYILWIISLINGILSMFGIAIIVIKNKKNRFIL